MNTGALYIEFHLADGKPAFIKAMDIQIIREPIQNGADFTVEVKSAIMLSCGVWMHLVESPDNVRYQVENFIESGPRKN